MSSIAKLCANHLRIFSNSYGVKLKSAHAHELVASFFGYKSKAAMLADTTAPIDKIGESQYLILTPVQFVDQRRGCLENFPSDLPITEKLCEELSVFLKLTLSSYFFTSWQYLAEVLTKEYLQKHKDLILPINFRIQEKANDIFDKPFYEFNPRIATTDSGIELMVANSYSAPTSTRFEGSIDIKISIKLQRVAGHIGYNRKEISFIDGSSHSLSHSGVTIE